MQDKKSGTTASFIIACLCFMFYCGLNLIDSHYSKKEHIVMRLVKMTESR